ncbi:DNA-binding transcriptional regulator, MerR family [Saccharopolyspora antimicrobica]|uniref:DNA-binding transcriptional MerR regulator n=1 Tax=Saccharopolyspora antimicrobica TaxID=455193 RepID=A0A1I4Y6G4_9PSEU|nr:MerR family transcriptional regulator [Saccharopolyspora antimicrobica]RKT82545.1 DNA-binding transcriptional MerR regulator [Saccharopolyspora antimicrobica]SFN33654.1 DNA-binding transcriptional regulator, MerR family [Saccharopolyspora antimicrobica]
MRIGEIAAMVGVSTRAVRHYHHQGLLPEPQRRANGYRHYGLRDAIVLARIRRLTELGLSLDEVRDALADDGGRELREILVDLDRELAEQEQRIRDRRARLGLLIERAERGELDADSAVSPGTAELLAALNTTEPASPMAVLERELFALMDTTGGEQRDQALAVVLPAIEDPALRARGHELQRRLDELAEAAPDDPRVAPLAEELADSIPAEVSALIGDDDADNSFSTALFDSVGPARAEVLRRAIRLLAQRPRDEGDLR